MRAASTAGRRSLPMVRVVHVDGGTAPLSDGTATAPISSQDACGIPEIMLRQ